VWFRCRKRNHKGKGRKGDESESYLILRILRPERERAKEDVKKERGGGGKKGKEMDGDPPPSCRH